ncbi:Hypothetical predicted protein [Pelobates cultripes]|uniref:Uncharacterized protein n=1 Tax=Pelobates cultripes TaxID=61616 RepID=A0AAD1W9S0_PELCU|nr:Hypothetical predicted protein [Pelobates cultripes]
MNRKPLPYVGRRKRRWKMTRANRNKTSGYINGGKNNSRNLIEKAFSASDRQRFNYIYQEPLLFPAGHVLRRPLPPTVTLPHTDLSSDRHTSPMSLCSLLPVTCCYVIPSTM